VLDAISFERRGIPAAVVITEPFTATAAAIAKLSGLPDYPYAVIPHPVGSLTAKEVLARADAIGPRVIDILLRGARDGA